MDMQCEEVLLEKSFLSAEGNRNIVQPLGKLIPNTTCLFVVSQ